MPIPQGRLLTSLLLTSLSAVSWADQVIVNTTTDETAISNSQCSLREAVAYLNVKNTNLAILDEEIAVISGTSKVLSKQLLDEKAKVPQNTVEIDRLDGLIKAGLLALNTKLREDENKLILATNETDPDKKIIADLKTTIAADNAAIKIKEDAKAAKEKERLLKDFRAQGLNGCTSAISSDTDSIALTTGTAPYEISTIPITIDLSVTINLLTTVDSTTSSTGLSGLEQTGTDITPRTVIKAVGNHALFIINDSLATTSTVTFNNIDLQGCNQATSGNVCAVDGGLILNKEKLTIVDAILSGGNASGLGGAIYNSAGGSINASQLLFQSNSAPSGAAVYSEQSSASVSSSLFTKNTGTNIFAINEIAIIDQQVPIIQNTTFSGNSGVAISSKGVLIINNSTIVLNDGGINLNNTLPTIYNSIIAGNTAQGDCLNFKTLPVDTSVYFSNNLFQTGCDIGAANTHNHQISGTGNETLMAASVNGKCEAASLTSVGLLCPLAENGGLTKTHKPRLLVSYTSLDDSPIVNKGFINNNGAKGVTCYSVDQRQLSRGLCDIGAVEIQGLTSTKQGQDITFGQSAKFDLLEKIGDGELWPSAQCQDLYGAGTYVDGCARLAEFPAKGVVSFDDVNDQVVYKATLSNFHGFDKFAYLMTTTISRFSDASNNDRFVRVDVKVVSEPDTSTSSKSLDTGATGLFSLFMLSLLMVWRRLR